MSNSHCLVNVVGFVLGINRLTEILDFDGIILVIRVTALDEVVPGELGPQGRRATDSPADSRGRRILLNLPAHELERRSNRMPDSPEEAAASPETKISTTPEYHNILIQNVTVTGYNTNKNSNDKNYNGIMIYGRPESYVYDVTFDNVKISHRNGVRLFFCKDIKFINGCTFTKTRTNTTVEITASDLSDVMEHSYEATYSWNQSSTGITPTTTTNSLQPDNDVYHSLSGHRTTTPSKGIYIHQGKKIFIKK
jgi:hypothetical protein